MSVKKAIFLNFITALTAFAGLYLGLILGNNEVAQRWILAVCGGIFLYVALTDMVIDSHYNDSNLQLKHLLIDI